MYTMWFFGILCGAGVAYFVQKTPAFLSKHLYALCVFLNMTIQLYCLYDGHLFTLSTCLPLHLCSFSSILILLYAFDPDISFLTFICALGRLGAMVALFFPFPIKVPLENLSYFCFFFLHSLLVFFPFSDYNKGKGRMRAETLGALLICVALIVNRVFQANYLFLSRLPFDFPFVHQLSPLLKASILFAFMYLGLQRYRHVQKKNTRRN